MSGWPKTLQVVYVGFAVFIYAGVTGVVLGLAVGELFLRGAAVVFLAGIVGRFLTLLVAGIVTYRQTMRRPWPKVPPIVDDDEDW